jgi:hypothetical protein
MNHVEYVINNTSSVDNLNPDARSLSNKRNQQPIIASKRIEVARPKGGRVQKPVEAQHYHATGPSGLGGSRRHSKGNTSNVTTLRPKQPQYIKGIKPTSELN